LSGDGSNDEAWEEVSQAVFQTVRIGSRVRLQDESGSEVLYPITSSERNSQLNGGCLPPALLGVLLGGGVGEEVHVWTSSRGCGVMILEVD